MSDTEPVKPNFLIIGAQRCGTTMLWQTLRRHPAFFLPDRKELEFFSTDKSASDQAFGGYLHRFAGAGHYRFRGEASPSYLMTQGKDSPPPRDGHNPHIPQRVRERLGQDIRLVVTLRNPVERAVSAYFHHYFAGRIQASESILDGGRRYGIIDAGFFGRHLTVWLEWFPARCFHVTHLDALVTGDGLDRLRDFFDPGIESFTRPARENRGARLLRVGGTIRAWRSPLGPVVTRHELDELANLYSEDQRRLESILAEVSG